MARLGLERGTLRRDVALAVLSFAGGLVMLMVGAVRTIGPLPTPRTGPALFLIPLAAICVAVALRRIATRTSLAVGTLAFLGDFALGTSLGTILIFTQVLYDACVYGPPRMWRWLLRLAIGLTGLAVLAGVVFTGAWQGLAFAIPVVLIAVLPVVTGISVRQYRDQAATERARAEQTARLAELDRRQAVSAERTRMARELHDVIANHLSAVAIHASAALSVRGLDRDQVQQALRVIRENSVQGLAEMRQMVELLREPAGGSGPPVAPEAIRTRLAEVDRLVQAARDAGLSVRLATTGEARPLPVSVDLAAYRIVQESLTNALKHGAGEAAIAVGYAPDRVSVTVDNPLRTGARTASPPGAGAGLIGMRERAALLHGRLDAGPHGQGWRVHAELPTREVPA